jgi:hypothetical protein
VEGLEGRALLSNLIVNGDFEAVTTGSNPIFPSISDYRYEHNANNIQFGPTANPLDAAEYTLITNPSQIHYLGVRYGDHTTGTGRMMVLNGATTANVMVWSQTVGVSQGTTYTFSTWISTWISGDPARLEFSINGTTIGTASPPSTGGVWQEFSTTWNSGSNTTATIRIDDRNTEGNYNDFALDDISLTGSDEPDLAVTPP